MQRDFEIEEINNPEYASTIYRMKLHVGAEVIAYDVHVAHYEQQRDVALTIESGVESLLRDLKSKIMAVLDHISRTTGHYDSTRFWANQERVVDPEDRLDCTGTSLSDEWLNEPAPATLVARRMYRWPFPTTSANKPTADKKAMKLLASKIGFRKMRQLKKKGYFEETGKHGVFRFHMNTQGGVSLIERKKYGSTEREVEWSLCVQSMASDLPKGDVILSRWMEWKADEDKFLDTANFRNIKTRDEALQGRV